MRVDLGVALGPHGQVEAAVLAQLGQHVIEERHAGADLDHPDAVQVELDHDLCLVGEPLHPRHSVHQLCPPLTAGAPFRRSTSSRPDRNAAISSPVPTVPPTHPARPTPPPPPPPST